jgi:16S rRNA (guanine527-N7)-methyltransferase
MELNSAEEKMSYVTEDEFRTALAVAVADFQIEPLTEHQCVQLEKHYTMLCKWNKSINLTRITIVRDAARHHYAESLFGAQFIANERMILDIGSGAGFPAVPLAVARPDIQVTALEANKKKSLFLREAKDELGLSNLRVVTARLEEFDWSAYEIIASRALDRAETILPPIIEGLGTKQRLMLYCGPDLVERLREQRGTVVETYPIPQSQARLIAFFSLK